jgi:hypothetical protein
MVKRVECRVISTVPTGGFNSRSGQSPQGSQGDPLSNGAHAQEVADTPSGPYGLFGDVARGIVVDFLA